MLLRRVCSVALTTGLLGVAACGHQPDNPQKRAQIVERGVSQPEAIRHRPPPRSTSSDLKATLLGVTRMLQTLYPTTTTSTTVPRPVVTAPAVSMVTAPVSMASVMACIRAHESGDYTSNTHPPDGSSGAYQATGPTWRYWSTKAGYGGYQEAYEAPPSVQDAVVLFMLQNGGAHNWDPKYGNDPCTVGLP